MNWLRNFMYGRRGMDPLGMALLILSIVFLILSHFLLGGIFSLLALASLVYCYYRALSRDVYRRAAENERFMRFWRPHAGRFRTFGARMRDTRTHCHFKCPGCGQKLRVPRGRGKLEVTCPHCHLKFIKET